MSIGVTLRPVARSAIKCVSHDRQSPDPSSRASQGQPSLDPRVWRLSSLMSEVDKFLAAVLPLQDEADTALHTGDANPRKALWSHTAPVTVFGAAKTVSGWAEVEQLFD